MTVEWPDRRGDVLTGLDVFASPLPTLTADGRDPRWPDLTNAVRWVVDDTDWDHRSAMESIGTLLVNEAEAVAVGQVVALVLEIGERQGAVSGDAAWFRDPDWPTLRQAASLAAAVLRSNGG